MTSVSLIPASLLVLVFLVTVLGAAWTYLDKVSIFLFLIFLPRSCYKSRFV